MGRRILETVQGTARCPHGHTWRAVRRTIQKYTARKAVRFKATTTQQIEPAECPDCGQKPSSFTFED